MKKPGFTSLIVALVITALALLAGGYWYWQRGTAVPTLTQIPTAVPSPTPEASPLLTPGASILPAEINPGWQKVRSEKYSYSIEFPGDWRLNASDLENVNFYHPDVRYEGASLVKGIHFWIGVTKLSRSVVSASQLATNLSDQFEQSLEASLLEGPNVIRAETPFEIEYTWQGFGRPEAINRIVASGVREFSLSCVHGADYRKEAKAACNQIFETFQVRE